jgi:hypothetical protein
MGLGLSFLTTRTRSPTALKNGISICPDTQSTTESAEVWNGKRSGQPIMGCASHSDWMVPMNRIMVFVALVLLGPRESARAQPPVSCADLEYKINNNDIDGVTSFATIERLSQALTALENTECHPYLKLRALWAKARSLDAFAISRLLTDPSSVRRWRVQAASAHRALLDWTIALSRPSLERLVIRAYEMTPGDSGEFATLRVRLVQNRPEKSLFALVNNLVAIGDFEKLFEDIERYTEQLPESFSNRTIQEWVKWLRAQQDFKVERADGEVQQVLSGCDACKGRWATFVHLVRRGSSIRPHWHALAAKVEPWLN